MPEAEEVVTANNWALWRKLLEGERSSVVEDSIARMSQEGALTAGKQISHLLTNVLPRLSRRASKDEIGNS